MRDNVPVIGNVHAASDARPVHRLINELTGTRLRPQNDVHTFVTGRRSIVGAGAQTSSFVTVCRHLSRFVVLRFKNNSWAAFSLMRQDATFCQSFDLFFFFFLVKKAECGIFLRVFILIGKKRIALSLIVCLIFEDKGFFE